MLNASNISPIIDMPCIIQYDGVRSEDYIIETPNRGNLFEFSIRTEGESTYWDGNEVFRKGSRFLRVYLTFYYRTHTMNLSKLLACRYIDFNPNRFNDQLDLPFSNTKFKPNTNSFTKNWFKGMPITKHAGTEKEANPIPSGELTLEFKSVEQFKHA